MKLIHCADLHLDAKMEATLPKEKAKERKLEILRTFTRLADEAERIGAEGILLCGDLFDAKTISARARNCVLDALQKHPGIVFYYLQGNHDQNSFLADLDELPDNLKIFGTDWTTFDLGDVQITGAEITDASADGLMDRLILDADKVQIVMLHGTVSEYGNGSRKEGFSLKKLRGKNIDYLALGHIHSYRQEQLDERGVWCYSGCLEGRGFDECGLKGYVELDVTDQKISSRFVSFAQRTLHEIFVDISGLLTQEEIQERIQKQVQEIPSKDLLKIVLTGETAPEAEKDIRWIEKWLENDWYFLKVKDESGLLIRPEDYQYDISLKGEFVRLVLASRLKKEEKEQILRMGIRALSGEE